MKIVPIIELPRPYETTRGPKNVPDWGVGQGAVVFQSGGDGKFGRVIHVAYLNDQGLVLFDGMLRAERGGAVDLLVDKQGRFGLQERERPQTTLSDEAWKADFDAGVINLDAIGRKGFEVPRGFSNIGEKLNKTAQREGEEETGREVARMFLSHWTCDNTASSPHMTGVFEIQLDLERASQTEDPDAMKALSSVQWFNAEQLLGMIENGTLYCAYTLAAMTPTLLLRTRALEIENEQLKARLNELEKLFDQAKRELKLGSGC